MQVTADYPGREGKEQILETYLNLIYYGNGSYGIKAAAANYFGLTNLADMTISQAAFLAALPQAPSFLDPYQNPNSTLENPGRGADALRERNLVLGAMREEGTSRPPRRRGPGHHLGADEPDRLTSILQEPHFSFRVRSEAERILATLPGVTDGALAVRTGGYRITTTLDYPLQQEAKARPEVGREPAAGNVNNSALVAIDSATGEIVAYVGSVDYYNREDPRGPGPVRRRRARQAPAGIGFQADHVRLGLPVPRRDRLDDARRRHDRVRHDGRDLVPADQCRHQGTRSGPGDGRTALLAQHPLGADAGPGRLADDGQLRPVAGDRQRGHIMGEDPGLSLALGSVPVNLTNMTQAYSTFAQQGELNPATTIIEIRDRDNRVVYTREDNGPESPTR